MLYFKFVINFEFMTDQQQCLCLVPFPKYRRILVKIIIIILCLTCTSRPTGPVGISVRYLEFENENNKGTSITDVTDCPRFAG